MIGASFYYARRSFLTKNEHITIKIRNVTQAIELRRLASLNKKVTKLMLNTKTAKIVK